MKVLLLTPCPERITPTLAAAGDTWEVFTDPPPWPIHSDIVVSYGYRHIVREPLISRCVIVNLHIALLPWNRGADPNFWSWLDGTPKGVTIHRIDGGVDTGPIYAQERVPFGADETLASSYEKLRLHMDDLFSRTWVDIRDGRLLPRPQVGAGSTHRHREFERLFPLLPDGFATPVRDIPALAGAARAAR